ncbi:ankyrin repeat domain-containing protein [Methylibium sp.]|uniref:ankyrin repeat domain-containing protein n=1 Tax=Methylibium sp. TaxID=2067992 RepID=UPI003D11BF6E
MNNMKNIFYVVALLAFSSANAGSYDDFFRAVIRDDSAVILDLVSRGFDPNAPDANGQPAIIRALFADAAGAALTLARLPGTNANARNKAGETPLMIAALKGQPEVARVLIERGADVDLTGWTPLHYAAAGNSLPVLQLLLQRGAQVDARAPNGRTALMLASLHASEELVDALLAAGADPGARERNGLSAADLAKSSGREHLARRLAALPAR